VSGRTSVPVRLQPGVVYLSPSGKPCRWAYTRTVHPGMPREATFLYDMPDGRAASSLLADGFTLAEPAWSTLRRVG